MHLPVNNIPKIADFKRRDRSFFNQKDRQVTFALVTEAPRPHYSQTQTTVQSNVSLTTQNKASIFHSHGR